MPQQAVGVGVFVLSTTCCGQTDTLASMPVQKTQAEVKLALQHATI